MNIKLLISQIFVTAVYGALSNTVWAGNSLYNNIFLLLLIYLFAAVMINLVCGAAIKLEAYYLIEGYDSGREYDKNVLNNYFQKLSFNISVLLTGCSAAAFAAPLFAGIDTDNIFIFIYANLTNVLLFCCILLTAKKNAIK